MVDKLPLRIALALTLLLPISANAQKRGGYCQAREASCILESFGYTPSCVMNALSTCEENSLYSSIEEELKRLTQSMSNLVQEQSPATSRPRHCADLKKKGDTSGVKTIYPYDAMPNKPVKVYCDQETDKGGWTLIIRRDDLPFREDFNRTWVEYVLGFGNVDQEFWLGLDNIYALTNGQLMELRVDMQDWDQDKRFSKYRYFHIGDASTKYTLKVGGYSGDGGDSFVSEYDQYNHYGMKFTTLDNDNDNHDENCAGAPLGGWWYNRCHMSNFNGLPLVGAAASIGQGVTWHTFRGTFYSLKKATMMLRPAFS